VKRTGVRVSLRLVKTVRGHAGAPDSCSCGCVHFVAVSAGWSCEDCRKYYGPELTVGQLKVDLKSLTEKMVEFKNAIKDLEHLVR